MGIVATVLKFAVRELARPCLEKIGEHVGDSIGTVIGKRIDPNHGKKDQEECHEDSEKHHSGTCSPSRPKPPTHA